MPSIAAIEPIAVLRIVCGLWFLPHIVGKALNIDRATLTFEKAGLRPGRLFIFLAIGLEVLAAIGLVFNFHSVTAAGLGIVVLLGAAYAVVRINGFNWRWQKQGPEYMVLWVIVLLAIAVDGVRAEGVPEL